MPGFLADDDSTWLLRQFLTRLGYSAHPWGQDRNLGASAMGGYEPLVNEILKLHRSHGKKVSLIGWSLGGVHSLAVAHRAEYAIRSVITLGSPLRPPSRDGSDMTSIGRALQTAAGTINARPIAAPEKWRNMALKLSDKLPVSSIYSKSDGVVPWQRSQLEKGPRRENIQVIGSHIGLGFNPTVYYAIADRLNEEGIRPVYSDHWYAKFIDGLLENTVLIGKPAWNKKSRSRFRHIENGRIVPTDEEMKEMLRVNCKEDWYQGDEPIFDPVIPTELFDTLQQKLQLRRRSSPKRSPKSETLWLGGLFVCAETNRKLAGNSQGKHFRVNHPEHKDKKLYFAEAEYFVSEYLQRVGKRLDAMTEQSESRKLLEKLATDEWMTELKLDYIVMELEGYLSRNLSFGFNKVGDTEVILDEDDEGKPVITTDGDYVELYCQMTKDYLEQNRNEVHAMREERDLLATECIKIKGKMQSDFLYERYMQRIDELSADIEAASSSVDYRAWLEEVQNEVELLRQKQEQVQATMERGDYVQKAEAIRNLIDRIVCHWARVPTDDKRFNDGYRTVCDQVDVYAADGEIMTIEGTSR